VSVHGANRLGGNSLLDTVVFGKHSGRAAAKYVQGKSAQKEGEAAINKCLREAKARIEEILARKGAQNHSDIRVEMKETMITKVGIFREKPLMEEGLAKIRELKERYKSISVQNKGKVYNVDLIRALELEGMLDVAEAIVVVALKREESRGAHSRLDFKERDDDKFLKHTIATWTPKGPEISYSPVKVTKYKPEARRY
jgi:succinate dehydrogenase/fumarate reductase flavoprotein subunit